jgi:L-alanine-DL-glutamate epimerase-like enolase superfamily enzyme
MLFGMETAMIHLKSGGLQFYDSPWSRGEEGIPINGLVWMGTKEEMQERLIEKIEASFSCIKLKIGVDLEGELELLEYVRRRFGRGEVQLRVDANGAFSASEAGEILRCLHSYDLHSIEQPIRAGQWKDMARLCCISSLPIALDEELIGINELQEKERLLDEIKPSYLVLKPSLHGGMQGTREWVELARQRGIGSWVTSALESNVGLHAIAHLTTQLYGNHIEMAQGLGTGLLYTDNIDMPLCIKGQEIWHQ